MKTGIIPTTIKWIFQVILYGSGICFLILINGFFVPKSSEHIQQAYPPPGTTQPYPPPGMIINTSIYIDTVDASSPQLLNPKDGHVLSSNELNAIATYAYERSLVGTPPAPGSIKEPTLSNFPILSINDLTQIIYQNASYTNPEEYFGDCILSRTPGTPVLVQS